MSRSISRKRIDPLLICRLYLAAQLCFMERCVALVSEIQSISLLLVACFRLGVSTRAVKTAK